MEDRQCSQAVVLDESDDGAHIVERCSGLRGRPGLLCLFRWRFQVAEKHQSALLTFKGAGTVDVVDVVGGRRAREEQGRNGQQSTSDSADAPSLVHLLSALVLRARDEPPGSSLLTCKGAEGPGTVEVVGRRSRRRGRRQQRTSDSADAASLVHLLFALVLRGRDKPPGSSLLTCEGAGKVEVVEVVGRRSRRRGRRQERRAAHERQRGRTVARPSALRIRPRWTR